MDYINEIISNDKSYEETIAKIIDDYNTKKIRYDDETAYLRFIITQQLNLRKNKVKGKFESLTFDQLFCLLLEEIYELKEELTSLESMDFTRILSEVGDIGAFLVGFTAKVIQESKYRAKKEETKNETLKTAI